MLSGTLTPEFIGLVLLRTFIKAAVDLGWSDPGASDQPRSTAASDPDRSVVPL